MHLAITQTFTQYFSRSSRVYFSPATCSAVFFPSWWMFCGGGWGRRAAQKGLHTRGQAMHEIQTARPSPKVQRASPECPFPAQSQKQTQRRYQQQLCLHTRYWFLRNCSSILSHKSTNHNFILDTATWRWVFCAAGITFKAHPQFITLKAGETPSALHQAPELPGWPLPSTPTPGFRNQGSKPLQQSTLTRPGKRSWLQWEAIHWDLWVQMQHQHKNLVLFLQLVPVHFCWMTSQSSSSVSIIGVSPHLSYRTQQVAPFFLWRFLPPSTPPSCVAGKWKSRSKSYFQLFLKFQQTTSTLENH